jgi:hypothetical protein
MNNDYEACRSLYRAARSEEHSSQTDRHAVRLALTTAITASLNIVASGASAASVLPAVGTGVSAVGTKGVLQLILGGKFISGLICGAALGSAVVTTAVVVRPKEQSVVATRPSKTLQISAPHRVEGQQSLVSTDNSIEPYLAATSPSVAELTVPNGAKESPNLQPRVLIQKSATPAAMASAPLPGQYQLADETMALAKVQDALGRQDPSWALELINEQKRQFASGQLGEERAAAEVIALCGVGRAAEAEVARRRFTATYPNSPLNKRVSIGCGHE